ncbi:hypothetical protein BRD01_02245 [Halobacteriales archaeon QS_8_65_32]|nr:MAG: hypothetical protein BRD01_02245 [Halobacteriales archaeon QS_8_65_32]
MNDSGAYDARIDHSTGDRNGNGRTGLPARSVARRAGDRARRVRIGAAGDRATSASSVDGAFE